MSSRRHGDGDVQKRPGRRITIVQAGLGTGGTEKIVSLLARHLDGQGHAVSVLAITGLAREGYYPMPPDVTVRTMEEERGKAASTSTLSRTAWLRKALREEEAELVISFLTKINVQVAVAAVGLGVRRIASERNNFLQQTMNPLWRLLMPVAIATADGGVTLTRAAREALPAWARRRAVAIYNPVPVEGDEPVPGTPPRRLIAVGRLTEQKGFDILIRAIHLARAQGCNLSLTIHGEGEDRESLTALVQSLGLSEHVRLPGRTQRPHEWTEGGGIFVLSSRYEGFGNVLVEALAAGFAVISTNCNWGPAEIVRHDRDGLLVPPEDPEALAEAIVRVWEDDALRARLAAGAVRRAADFSERQILSEWDAVIARAFGGRTPATGEALPSRS
jgi:glycosyltransferase involved in cell wall biosynthesis